MISTYRSLFITITVRKLDKLSHTLCAKSTGSGEFLAQMASNPENVSIWWRHHHTLDQDIKDLFCQQRLGKSALTLGHQHVIKSPSAHHTIGEINALMCDNPDNKVRGAYKGPTWGRQDPGWPHVGPMNLAIREYIMPWWRLYIRDYKRLTIKNITDIATRHPPGE